MGYYTMYTLSVESGNDQLIKDLRKSSEWAEHAINEDGSTGEGCKWYDHEDDLRTFSKLHPNELFILEGEGEESDDIWKKYIKNGKVQTTKAKFTFEEFNPSKLK